MIKKSFIQLDNPEYSEVFIADEVEAGKSTLKLENFGTIQKEISVFFYRLLESYNIQTVFVTDEDLLTSYKIRSYESVPVYIKVINSVQQSINKLLVKDKGFQMKTPVFEFYLNGDKNYPMNESHLTAYEILTADDAKTMIRVAAKTNTILKSFFTRREYSLSEFDLSFGRTGEKLLVAADFNLHNIKLNPLNNSKPKFDLKKPDKKRYETTFEMFKNFIIQSL